MHRVVVDRSQALVSLIADGWFTDDAVTAAATDLHVAIRSLGDRVGKHVTLYDVSGLKVLSSAVLERFANYFRDPAIAPLWARRVALVTQSALLLRQMERVSQTRHTLRVFQDRREAMVWLLDSQERLPAQPVVALA